MRNSMKMFLGMSAAAVVALGGTSASAADLGLVINGDMELVSRFTQHGAPGADTVAGIPDGWGHSGHTGWSNPGDPVVSGIHSLRLSDFDGATGGVFNADLVDATLSMEEGRSFVLALPTTSLAGDVLHVEWNWAYDITSNATGTGDQFSANIRLSTVTAGDSGCCNLIGAIDALQTTVLTNVSSTGGAFLVESVDIVLPAGINTFDIIFNTGNRLLADTDPGKFDVTGTMFVDDVSAIFLGSSMMVPHGTGGLWATITLTPPSSLILDGTEITAGNFTLEGLIGFRADGSTLVQQTLLDPLAAGDDVILDMTIGDSAIHDLFSPEDSFQLYRLIGNFDATNPDISEARFDILVGVNELAALGTESQFTFFLPSQTSDFAFQVTDLGTDPASLLDNIDLFSPTAPVVALSATDPSLAGLTVLTFDNGIDPPFFVGITPEPATLGLFALGGLALLRRRR